MRPNFYTLGYIVIGLLFLVTTFYFFTFTVEDAYIAYRYAEKFVATGALIYNEGDYVNALTSPLHGIILSVIFFLTGKVVVVNKLVSLSLLLYGTYLLWKEFGESKGLQIAIVILTLLCPPVILWTFGGLETIYLLFFVVMTVLQTAHYQKGNTRRLILIFVLTGICFVLRYDSAVFFFPVIFYLFFKSDFKDFLKAAMIGSIIPLTWLTISFFYYGDIFPTSYYLKKPVITSDLFLLNYIYIRNYFFSLMIIPLGIIAFIYLVISPGRFQILSAHFIEKYWMYLGVALYIGYGFTMATKHMMFSLRFFVPYIPVTIFLMLDLYRKVSEQENTNVFVKKAGESFMTIFIVVSFLTQCYLLHYTYNISINGKNVYGEYRKLNVEGYRGFMDILSKQSDEINIHWKNKAIHKREKPYIHTYAGGIVSYRCMDAYIYDGLVSYRHKYTYNDFFNWKSSADYILIVSPRHGTIENQLGKLYGETELISSTKLMFDGSEQYFQVYYNPNPEPHILKSKIIF